MDTVKKKKQMLEALEASLGVVTTACNKLGLNRSTYYLWYNNDEDFRNSVHDIADVAIDFVESKLFQQINDGNTAASIFYLKTKAKKRGYTERSELELSGGTKPVNIIVEIDED